MSLLTLCTCTNMKFLLLLICCTLPKVYSTDIHPIGVCVHEYKMTDHLYVGTNAQTTILMCRCGCDRDKNNINFGNAKYNHETECLGNLKNLHGFCMEIPKDNMIVDKCPDQGGFGVCYVRLLFGKTYEFKRYQYQQSVYVFKIGQNNTLSVSSDRNNFEFDGDKYNIFDSGYECRPLSPHVIDWCKNINNDDDTWLEKSAYSKFDYKFIHSDWYNISDSHFYHMKLAKRFMFKDGLCEYKLGQYELYADNVHQSEKLNLTLYITESSNDSYVMQPAHVVIVKVKKVKVRTTLTPVATTDKLDEISKITATNHSRYLDAKHFLQGNSQSKRVESPFLILILTFLLCSVCFVAG